MVPLGSQQLCQGSYAGLDRRLGHLLPRRYPQLPRALTDGVHPRDHLVFALLVTGLVIRLPRVKQQALYTVSEKMNVVISCCAMSQRLGDTP